MGTVPLSDTAATDEAYQLVLDGLIRSRGEAVVGELIELKPDSTHIVEHILDSVDGADVIMLEAKLTEARNGQDVLQSNIGLALRKIKSTGVPINSEAADGYRKAAKKHFDDFLQAQNLVTAIRGELNALKDVLQAR